MGWFPTTPEEIAAYEKRMKEIDEARARVAKAMEPFGLKPIPKDQYGQYWIFNEKNYCKKCGHPKYGPLGAFPVNDDWYDYLELKEAVFRFGEYLNEKKG